MKVLKFGGSSLATPEAMSKAVRIVKDESAKGRVSVVVSALGGRSGELKVTDQLISMAEGASRGDESYRGLLQQCITRHRDMVDQILHEPEKASLSGWLEDHFQRLTNMLQALTCFRELSLATLDYVMSFGERFSAAIFAAALRSQSVEAEYLDARLVIRTDAHFGSANVDFEATNCLIQDHFRRHPALQVMTGFIGHTSDEWTTTLGRDGSDYSAAVLGSALSAEEIQIWKEVPGVMTAHPGKVKGAQTIDHMTYREASELSHHGTKAIHPPTMIPARAKGIPIIVKNTFDPSHPGTRIDGEQNGDQNIIKGVSSLTDVAQFNLTGAGMKDKQGLAQRVFGALGEVGISISFIVQVSSEQSISFTVPAKDAQKADDALHEELADELEKNEIDTIEYSTDRVLIAIVGEKMSGQKGTLATVAGTLAKNGINIVSIGQSPDEFNITVIVPKKDEIRALQSLHDAFLHANKTVLNLMLVGPGKVGARFLEMVGEQNGNPESKVEIRVVGIVNSTKALMNQAGIPLERWKQDLESADLMTVGAAFDVMKSFELTNTVLVDTSASADAAALYPRALEASTAVVAANKVGFSGSKVQRNALQIAATKGKVPIKKETTVGAGLPVMVTLDMLRASGDKVHKVEAVLSGTLSYLFNTYDGTEPFSQLVRRALDLGYTEPNPKDDLNMMDVARKLLILSDEMGLKLEMSDIRIEHFISEACLDSTTPEEFFTALEQMDAEIKERCEVARAEGKVMRCLASIENGVAKVGLQAVDNKHPMYSLSGSANMISFVTNRYHEDNPLVVRGPGAGPDVTAAGVLSDTMMVADYFS
jgi:aspartokinase/homoserine dehydrogenase 1